MEITNITQKKRSLRFLLHKKTFINLIKANCHYCKSPPLRIYKKRNLKGSILVNGVDRKNSDLGYVDDNCVACCKKCNYLKGNTLYREFLTWIKSIAENLQEPEIPTLF